MNDQVMMYDDNRRQGMSSCNWSGILKIIVLIAIVLFLLYLVKGSLSMEVHEVGVASPTEGAIPQVSLVQQK
jgi:hypothetical protein